MPAAYSSPTAFLKNEIFSMCWFVANVNTHFINWRNQLIQFSAHPKHLYHRKHEIQNQYCYIRWSTVAYWAGCQHNQRKGGSPCFKKKIHCFKNDREETLALSMWASLSLFPSSYIQAISTGIGLSLHLWNTFATNKSISCLNALLQ